MATYSALLEDIGGQTADISFGPSSSPAKIEVFLGAHCSAGLIGINKLSDLALSATSAAASSDIQRRALICAKNSANEPVRFIIPGPSVLVLTESTEDGERVTKASGDAICWYLSTMAGETFLFNYGIIIERE